MRKRHRHAVEQVSRRWRERVVNLLSTQVRTLALELRLQARDLVLELAEHGVLRVLVDLGLIFYIFGAVRVAQRGDGLVVVVARGPAVRAHDGLRISPQRILEQSSKFRVAVRDVLRLAVDQGADDVPQSRQRQIDLRGLLEAITSGLRLRLPFTTS